MSDTVKTAPYWAQGTLTAWHDHTRGESCDLPDKPRSLAEYKAQHKNHRCSWWPGRNTTWTRARHELSAAGSTGSKWPKSKTLKEGHHYF